MKLTQGQLHELSTSKEKPIKPGKVWAIGDVHGCAKTLKALYKKLNKPKHVYMMGDYFDAGPDSKAVIDFIMRHPNISPLRGNHEDYFLKAIKDKSEEQTWVKNFIKKGGGEVLKSFGVESIDQIPKMYVIWAKNLPYSASYKDFMLSHAGMQIAKSAKKDKAPDRETTKNIQQMLYNDNTKVPKKKYGVRLIVGHTPKTKKEIEKSVKTTKIYIDGGAKKGGSMVAFNLDTEQLVFQKNLDIVADKS
jgi:serine/threonine protein phosphatase 1